MKKTILPSLFLVFIFTGNVKSQVIFTYDDAGIRFTEAQPLEQAEWQVAQRALLFLH
jgi:hypothetical protein